MFWVMSSFECLFTKSNKIAKISCFDFFNLIDRTGFEPSELKTSNEQPQTSQRLALALFGGGGNSRFYGPV